jgi:hypothetical protein
MALYDLTHLSADAPCPTHDKDGIEIPSELRDFITKRRRMSDKEKMLIDMADAYKGVKAALALCKTDIRTWDAQPKEVLALKNAIFSKLEFAGLSLSNWEKEFPK